MAPITKSAGPTQVKAVGDILQNLNTILLEMGVQNAEVKTVSIQPQGNAFGMRVEDVNGEMHFYSGRMQDGKVSGTPASYLDISKGMRFDFLAASDQSTGAGYAFHDYGSTLPPNSSGQVLHDEQTLRSFPVQVNYDKLDPLSFSNGAGTKTELKFVQDRTPAPDKQPEKNEVSIPLTQEQVIVASANDGMDALVRQSQSPIAPNAYAAQKVGTGVMFTAEQKRPFTLTSDELTLTQQPASAYVVPMQRKFIMLTDGSETSENNRANIGTSVKNLENWVQTRMGARNDEDHYIGALPDDRSANMRMYKTIDDNLPAFEKHFRSIYVDKDVDNYLNIKQQYQNGLTKDPDGFALGIRNYIDKYERDIKSGKIPVQDLMLFGDCGNQYQKLVYDPNAKRKKDIWHWEFDQEQFDKDKALVEAFSRRHPDARIHVIHNPVKDPGQGDHPLTPPSDFQYISELATITKGKVLELSQESSWGEILKPQPPLVLIPKYSLATLEVKPQTLNPFLTFEASSKWWSPTSLKSNLVTTHLGNVVNLPIFIQSGKTGYPALDNDRGNRILETDPSTEALFRFLGMPDMKGKALPFSYLFDKYQGLTSVDDWAKSAYNDALAQKTSPTKKKEMLGDFLQINLPDIKKSSWPSKTGEFSQFGQRGEDIFQFHGYLCSLRYYRWIKENSANSSLTEYASAQYKNLTDAGIGYATRPLASTKADMSVYEYALWDAMGTMVNLESKSMLQAKLSYHIGETGGANPALASGEGRHPKFTVWAGMAYDPYISLPFEEEMYLQFRQFMSANFGLMFNAPLSRNPVFPVDFKADIAASVMIPTGKDASVDLISVGLLKEGYVAQWPLSKGFVLGAFRASLTGGYFPESKEFEARWEVRIAGLPSAATLSLMDHKYGLFGPDSHARDKSIAINPALETIIPPNNIGLQASWPFWNKIDDATGAMVKGYFDAQVVESEVFRVKRLGLQASVTPFEGGPAIILDYAKKGFTGLTSDNVNLSIQQQLGAFKFELANTLKLYPGKSLDYLTFTMIFNVP